MDILNDTYKALLILSISLAYDLCMRTNMNWNGEPMKISRKVFDDVHISPETKTYYDKILRDIEKYKDTSLDRFFIIPPENNEDIEDSYQMSPMTPLGSLPSNPSF